MAKQTINQGTAPTGAGGDTFRSGSAKLQANDDELYAQLGATPQGVLPAALPINKGGTGGATAAAARTSLGLGTAAVVNVGKSTENVPRVRDGFYAAYGVTVDTYIGSSPENPPPYNNANTFPVGERSLVYSPNIQNSPVASTLIYIQTQSLYTESAGRMQTALLYSNNPNIYKRFASSNNIYGSWRYDLTSANTTTDANGFIKAASPIVKLFADRIELNDEAEQQEITFEKLGVGDYLIKGSSGFAQEGWYVETPKDANGNVLFSVVYQQLENNDISIKTYKKKFDIETASIVADLQQPVDITDERFISLRLQELPQPEIEVTDDPEQ